MKKTTGRWQALGMTGNHALMAAIILSLGVLNLFFG